MNSKAHRPEARSGIRTSRITPNILLDKVFTFPDGLPAFEEVHHFMFACKPETAPFVFMRALEPAHLGFVCIDPFTICPGYKLNLSDGDTSFLDLSKPEEALILSIVTPSPDVHLTTANLQSPLIINLRNCRCRQIIGADLNLPVRYSIWEALKSMSQMTPVLNAPDVEAKCSAA